MIVALCVGGFLGACSSSSNDEGLAPTGLPAFNFNSGNAETAAELAASVMSWFSEYTQASQTMLTVLGFSDPNSSPIDLSLIMCASGRAILTWDDADVHVLFDLTPGDSASLQFTDCDRDGTGETVSGAIDVHFLKVGQMSPDLAIEHTVTLDLSITSPTKTTGIAANFMAYVDTPTGHDYTNTYSAADTTDQVLAITRNGVEYLKLGCFSVSATFEILGLLNDKTANLSPGGAINASNKIFSLDGGSTVSVVTGVFESGTQRLLSVSVPDCGAIGAPNGVADSDGSYLDMEMLGGNVVQLVTYDINGVQTSTLTTMWEALTQ